MLSRRMQILLDSDRYRKLERLARRRGTSVAGVVREAIDQMPEDDWEKRRAAIEAILAAEPMPVPADPHDVRRELDDAHDRVPG